MVPAVKYKHGNQNYYHSCKHYQYDDPGRHALWPWGGEVLLHFRRLGLKFRQIPFRSCECRRRCGASCCTFKKSRPKTMQLNTWILVKKRFKVQLGGEGLRDQTSTPRTQSYNEQRCSSISTWLVTRLNNK